MFGCLIVCLLDIVSHPRCGVVRILSSTLLLPRNSSPRPVYSSLIPGVPNPKCPWRAHRECPTPNSAWIVQFQSVAGVPSPRVSLECPTQTLQSVPGVPTWSFPGVPNPSLPGLPNPRVSPAQSVPGAEYLYQERVGMFEVK